MERTELLSALQEMVRNILDDQSIVLGEEMTVEDIDGWDSLTHVQLSSSIEEVYSVKLTLREMMSWETIGELADCIEAHLS